MENGQLEIYFMLRTDQITICDLYKGLDINYVSYHEMSEEEEKIQHVTFSQDQSIHIYQYNVMELRFRTKKSFFFITTKTNLF